MAGKSEHRQRYARGAGEIQKALEELIFRDRTEREKADFQKKLALHHAGKLAREIGRLSIMEYEGRLTTGQAMKFTLDPDMIGVREYLALQKDLGEQTLDQDRMAGFIDRLDDARSIAMEAVRWAGPNQMSGRQTKELEHLALEGQLRHIIERMPDLDPGVPEDWRTLREAFRTQRQPGTERMTAGQQTMARLELLQAQG